MSGRWFDEYAGDDPDVRAFVDALATAAEHDPPPVDPDDVWTLWLGACLYIAVPLPATGRFDEYTWIASDLEVCYRPVDRGRGVEAGWGDHASPLDAWVDVHGGRLESKDPNRSPEQYADIVLRWLHQQLARPLEVHGWTNAPGDRIVLADSGDVLARRGRQRWWRQPDLVRPLPLPPDSTHAGPV
ncbi:hypothetical protein ACI2K4_09625 [Micromonospora sp. NPDC050397]|uniref:hypothetical protein n=1 Tax=Micromonospora sp. NPDC050397 TaxID=3364279 RepID=UPI00384F8D9B